MSTYRNNYFAVAVQARVGRGDGWAGWTSHPWAPVPQCAPDMTSECLHLGAEYFDHVAPGFEGALDAPIFMPAGSMQASSWQPISD